jgi:hypothetical protein
MGTAAVAAAQGREVVIKETTVQGTVTAVDHVGRTMTIRSQQGNNIVTLDVPTSIGRFDQVKVGDNVSVAYDDRVTLRLKPANEPDVDRVMEPSATTTPGTLPGANIARQRLATVRITEWDPATRTVTFADPKGVSYTRKLAETVDPAVIGAIKVGERVDVTRTEALRLSVLPPATAAAQPQQTVVGVVAEPPVERRFAVSVEWGPDNSFSGDMIQASSGLTSGGIPINLNDTTYDDTYGRLFLFKVGTSYRMSPGSEIVGNFVWSHSDAENVNIGSVGAAGQLPLVANFGEMNYWGIEGGQRFYFTRALIKPFAGYLVGANRYDDINATFPEISPELAPGLAAEDGKFFEKSWAMSVGPTAGVLVGLGYFEVLGELQFRYVSGLSDVDWLVEEGLRDVNDDSDRWSIPFTIGARVRF